MKDVAAIEPLVRKALLLPKARPKPVVVEEVAVDIKKTEAVSTEVATLPTETATAESRSLVVEADNSYVATPVSTQAPVLVAAYTPALAEANVENEAFGGYQAPVTAEDPSSPSFISNVGRFFSAPVAAGSSGSAAAGAVGSKVTEVVQDSGSGPPPPDVAVAAVVASVETGDLSGSGSGAGGPALEGLLAANLFVPAQQVELTLSSSGESQPRPPPPPGWQYIQIKCPNVQRDDADVVASACYIPQVLNLNEANFKLVVAGTTDAVGLPAQPPIEVEFSEHQTLLSWELGSEFKVLNFQVEVDAPAGTVSLKGQPIVKFIYNYEITRPSRGSVPGGRT